MGCGFLCSLLLLSTLLLRSSASLELNTDEFFVYDFLNKAGVDVYPFPPSSSICPWRGVSCETSDGKHITRLSAVGLGLQGIIPDNTIGKLVKLEHLDLSNNGITGFSSDFWGLGSSLRTLNLSFNRINGSLTHNIVNFVKLERLDLSHNLFSGQVPVVIGSLSVMISLNLSSNFFSGSLSVSSFAGSKFLNTLDLSANKLSGAFPHGFKSTCRNLTHLNLAQNHLTGSLPNFTGQENLTYINLSGNLLGGPLVGMTFPMKLQVLDLSSNQLKSNHSKNFLALIAELPNLEHLNLSRTNLSGGIPVELSSLAHLTTLDLSRNHLRGHIPNFTPESLQVIDLSWNDFSGGISKSLQRKLLRMSKFNFSYNNLTVCSSDFPPEILEYAFIGSKKECPIAVYPSPTLEGGSNQRRFKLILVIVLSVFFLILGSVCLLIVCRRNNRKWTIKRFSFSEDPSLFGPFSFNLDSGIWVADIKSATSVPVVIFEKPLLNLTFADLLVATSHFDRGTLLAEGRFGPVYRAVLPSGIQVAVKVLVHNSTFTGMEIMSELEHLGHIKHPNLLPLTGYCIAGDQKIGIYEYMENGNLQSFLHDLPLETQSVEGSSADNWEDQNAHQCLSSHGRNTWRFRHKIALGTARALAFLHHGCVPQIIHRDVKASSIFLDSAFEPRLSDFGLAKIIGSDSEVYMPQGSPGYIPPELLIPENNCSATEKSDIYAFGVILFELVTGKKPIGVMYPDDKDNNLVNWVRELARKKRISQAIDPRIRITGAKKQMEEALRIGYLCTADVPSKRPSMQQIVGLLKDIGPDSSQ